MRNKGAETHLVSSFIHLFSVLKYFQVIPPNARDTHPPLSQWERVCMCILTSRPLHPFTHYRYYTLPCTAPRKTSSVEELELEAIEPASMKPRISHHWWPAGENFGKRKRSTIKTLHCFKASSMWETSKRQCGVQMSFPERVDTTLNWVEKN